MPKKPPQKYQPREILAEAVRRFGEIEDDTPQTSERAFKFKQTLFKQQQDLINDPAQFKAALCSRRAGKTYAACYYLLQVALTHPECLVAYLALTRNSAKRLLWTELKRANRKFHLGLKFNNSELICTCPNGSRVMLTGATDSEAVEALRGSAYRLVILDEAASFGKIINVVVDEIIEPSLLDHKGTLLLIGTPSAQCSGRFFDVTTKDLGYSVHHWTILDNPHIPHAEDWLDKRKRTRGWADNHPVYLREWCGKWAKSNDSLVYRYSEKNLISAIEDESDLEYIIGVDLGWNDATALVVTAYSDTTFYVVYCYKESQLLPSQVAEHIKDLVETYHPQSVVCDTAGLGKSIVEEMRRRYELPVRAAEKKTKNTYIELLNSDLHAGKVKIMRGLPLLDELDLLQWREDGRRAEDGRFDNHLCDAFLYAFRESKHYMEPEYIDRPKPGSPAWYKAEEQKHIQNLEDKIFNAPNHWWKDDPWMN